jgi:hypothetical protein
VIKNLDIPDLIVATKHAQVLLLQSPSMMSLELTAVESFESSIAQTEPGTLLEVNFLQKKIKPFS